MSDREVGACDNAPFRPEGTGILAHYSESSKKVHIRSDVGFAIGWVFFG
jgi:hypothetical protein